MPAHRPKNRDKRYEMHIMTREIGAFPDRAPDGHVEVRLIWHGGRRQWEIDGLLQPESPFLKPKHNWQTHVSDLPQSRGDAILSFLEWIQSFTEKDSLEGREPIPEE